MGTSHSFPELASKLKNSGASLKAAEKPAVAAGGRVVQSTFEGAVKAMGAGGSRGATVKTRQATSNGHPAVSVKFGPNPGWVAIMEGRVQPHFIGPHGRGKMSLRKQNLSSGRGRKSALAGALLLNALSSFAVGGGSPLGGGRAINIGGVGPRAYAFHPGVHKKKPFVQAGQMLAPPLAVAEMRKVAMVEFGKSFL